MGQGSITMHISKNCLAGLCVCLGMITPFFSQASGIAVSTAKLKVNLSLNEPNQASFSVSNPDSETQVFEIYSDELENYIKIKPQIFSLSPGGIKQVTLEISPEISRQKNHGHSYVSVISHPLSDSNLQIASGVKIELIIADTTSIKLPSNKNLFVGLVALGSLLAAAVWQKIKK